MKILIDNGHGRDTAGKRSPDGILQEWKYTREIAQRIVTALHLRGYHAEMLTPELSDTPLAERVRRVQLWCKEYGSTQVLLVSIHLNAAGNGSQWMNATGWEAYTSPGDTDADLLAACLYEEARKVFAAHTPSLKLRTDPTDGDPDKEANFYLLRKTSCPAVLTENFFMDSPQDYAYLLSDGGKDDLIRVHVNGILAYIAKKVKR
ncbi:N-acetylmuramoyl-L-alanine amidase [gut metagenome]|uniref:N-acetylmuramoyl-L-alanine amidase n=1 Tax=gut metagenome TaxID=749906 RepID=J9GIK2_9ZZZZ